MAKEKLKPKSKRPKPPGKGRMPAGTNTPANRWLPPEPRPDILFLIIDDLVAADLTPSRAPRWTAFKAQGRNFTFCYTMPICSQSRAGMDFGRYQRHIQAYSSPGVPAANGTVEYSPASGPEPAATEVTLASEIRKAGYLPELVGKWHLGRNASNPGAFWVGAPKVRGYENWTAGAPQNIGNTFGLGSAGTYNSWCRQDNLVNSVSTTYATIAQVQQAAARWYAMPKPRYLHVCISAPHAPFHTPPAELLEGYAYTPDPPGVHAINDNERYQQMIRSADWALGQLLSMQGVADALVIVCSDNGKPDGAAASTDDPNRLKGTAYDLGARVPLAIRGPSSMVQPGTDSRLVHLVDLPGTILKRVGLAIPSGWDSVDILANAGTAALRTSALIEATDTDGHKDQGAVGFGTGVVSSGYKLVRHALLAGGGANPGGIAADELYNLTTDPGELTPLALGGGNAAITAELRAVIDGP